MFRHFPLLAITEQAIEIGSLVMDGPVEIIVRFAFFAVLCLATLDSPVTESDSYLPVITPETVENEETETPETRPVTRTGPPGGSWLKSEEGRETAPEESDPNVGLYFPPDRSPGPLRLPRDREDTVNG